MKAHVIDNSTLELVVGDITHQNVHAIVNAANCELKGGGGVDGAINRAGGTDIMAECKTIGGCPTGSAVVTNAGNLKARYVFHAVGPVWRGGNDGEADLLESAYNKCLTLADEYHLKSIAFPSISTGVYAFPLDMAAPIALSRVLHHLAGETGITLVRFVLFDDVTFIAYSNALDNLDNE